ncbi:LAG1 longevity assurance-like protein [Zostera marina]|uniref:LAG1 longevity assurance-like protein n=1 Tax=Zostera marina TaxID=29655 RepID=A0A0K9P0K3_ZOSMR|nr:LAG1 longevity assurance-like protein [Zostera marina]
MTSAIDFTKALYYAFGIGCLRWSLDAFVYQKLAIRIICNGMSLSKIDDSKRAKIVKISESMWKFTYFFTVVVWALSVVYNKPWSRDNIDFFRGWPDHQLEAPLKQFYMWQCGFFIYSIAALLTWETRRKDFSIMMSHHIVTTILITYSYLAGFFRIGCVILALHDACDVFLEAAKVFKYSELEMGASVCFGLFALSWLFLRLMFFPYWVIRSSSYLSIEFISSNENFTIMYYIFNTMLFTLLVFHIYWWILIYSMIMRQLKNRGKVGEDIRSDSDSDDD